MPQRVHCNFRRQKLCGYTADDEGIDKLSEDGNKMKDSKDVWKAKVDSMIEMLKLSCTPTCLGAT